MGVEIDLTGKTFGDLQVMFKKGKSMSNTLWECLCSCGNTTVRSIGSLNSGRAKHCGCRSSENKSTHGMSYHPLYGTYIQMLNRCYNSKMKNYENWGGRGITVCDRWLESVTNFIEDVYESYSTGLELDRIDNDKGYFPDNVRWVTPQQNTMNRRGSSKATSKFKGVYWKKGLSKWCASITKDKKKTHIGYFVNEKEAAMAYNKLAVLLFGEYAYLNSFDGEEDQAKVQSEIDKRQNAIDLVDTLGV